MDLSGRHPRCGEDVAPYALGALSPDDARAFEEHLAGCELCRTDLDALRPVVHALGETPEQVDPPPELRRRIMSVVATENGNRAAATERVARPRRRWVPALAAACVLLVVGVAIGIGVTGDGTSTYSPLSTPAGVRAQLEISGDGGDLEVHGMSQLQSDRVMQVWLVRGADGEPEPTDALFTPNRRGDASVAVPGDLEGVTRVMVSEEPRGGSRAPTGPPVLDFRVQNS